jgi:hypothetical protein
MTSSLTPIGQSISAGAHGSVLRHGATSKGSYVVMPPAAFTPEEVVTQAFDAFVNAMRDIPTVEQVRGQTASAYLHMVTYMSESSLEERFAVYNVQMRMYDLFPQLRLEFDVIDRKGQPVDHDDLTGKLVEVIRELPDRS